MEGFWRKPRADMENVRFSTSNSKYPDEGSSNCYSSNYMESLVLSHFMAIPAEALYSETWCECHVRCLKVVMRSNVGLEGGKKLKWWNCKVPVPFLLSKNAQINSAYGLLFFIQNLY